MYDPTHRPTTTIVTLEELLERAKQFGMHARAHATEKAYNSDWRDFEGWCQSHDLASLPATPETVALYIADRASTLASATITRRLTSITNAHRDAGFQDSPATTRHRIVGQTLQGIRRTIGTAQQGKEPLLAADLRKLVEFCPSNLLGARDCALILVGFCGAFRRSELARINREDLTFSDLGVVVDVRTSKTDQESAGRKVALPFAGQAKTCPVRSLASWLDSAEITKGPVFRAVNHAGVVSCHALNKDSIGTILKRAAKRAGLNPDVLGAHSLRAGHVTQAAMNGVSEFVIMKQTGHKSVTTLRRYIRIGELFKVNAASGLGI